MTDETTGLPPAETAEELVEPVATPESGEAEPEEPAKEPEEKPKPKGGFQRRIDELTRNWRESERRADELMTLLQRQSGPVEKAPLAAPTLEQHGYDEGKYQTALTDYVRGLTQTEARAAIAAERAQAQQETRTQSFKQREAEFAATVEDYADKVYDPSLPLSKGVVELIAESDIGPKVAYYLAENPDIARSLAEKTPTQAAREFGKLEARLSVPVQSKPVSKAPPPAPKVAASEPEIDRDPEKMTMKDWLAWREKGLSKKK